MLNISLDEQKEDTMDTQPQPYDFEDEGRQITTFVHSSRFTNQPETQVTMSTHSGKLDDILISFQKFLYACGYRWPKNYVLQLGPTDNFPREVLDDSDTEVSVN